jgi:hypothetical protein
MVNITELEKIIQLSKDNPGYEISFKQMNETSSRGELSIYAEIELEERIIHRGKTILGIEKIKKLIEDLYPKGDVDETYNVLCKLRIIERYIRVILFA